MIGEKLKPGTVTAAEVEREIAIATVVAGT
jgi:hypothetical protein